MYHVEPLDAYAKGEIFLGHTSSGYLIVPGFGPGQSCNEDHRRFWKSAHKREYNESGTCINCPIH